jgi:hypothetical protein
VARMMRIVTAGALLVAALIVTPAFAATTPVAALDLNAPVHSGTECMPCHATIGAAKSPGHIFQHGSHMTLSCEACHWAPPHSGGVTVLPSMQSCFNCHGLKHGSVQIASAACTYCHTVPRAKLVPADHVTGYAGKPHAIDSSADANRCLMCHTAESCDACHVKQNVKTPPTQPAYKPLMPDKMRRPALKMEPTGPVTMGQCVGCHPDLDRYIPGRIVFAHAAHLQKAFACKDCHRGFPHGLDSTARPDMPSCYQCHGLTHALLGLVASDQCASCHPKGFVLKPVDHTAAYVAKTHKDAANTSLEQCAMCHAAPFCVSCHQGKPKTPGGPARVQVIPAGHRLAGFRATHGTDFLKQKGACGSCHSSADCERCHTTPMPHPADWASNHALARDLNAQDCKVCHIKRQTCEECHHRNLHGAELTLANCVKCHPVMATVPATSVKPSALAEHAVHFALALPSKKGKPYKCEQCHVGFGFTAATAAGTIPATQGGHDLRSCYECHGALDYNNVQIAPYPGNSLCLRCHSDLHL